MRLYSYFKTAYLLNNRYTKQTVISRNSLGLRSYFYEFFKYNIIYNILHVMCNMRYIMLLN